jgi:excinuclease UvrABC helicase subunit UvrB
VETIPEFASEEKLDAYIAKLESDLGEAAREFEFGKAAKLTDMIKGLRTKEFLFS